MISKYFSSSKINIKLSKEQFQKDIVGIVVHSASFTFSLAIQEHAWRNRIHSGCVPRP